MPNNYSGMLNLIRFKIRLLRFSLLVAALLVALLFGTSGHAQDKTADIDKIFSWATPTAPGCVCAVSQNGKVIVNRAYGSADLERNVLLSPDFIFDAGSLVKQFVAASIVLLAEDGKLSLSDDVRKHIPQLPNYGRKDHYRPSAHSHQRASVTGLESCR